MKIHILTLGVLLTIIKTDCFAQLHFNQIEFSGYQINLSPTVTSSSADLHRFDFKRLNNFSSCLPDFSEVRTVTYLNTRTFFCVRNNKAPREHFLGYSSKKEFSLLNKKWTSQYVFDANGVLVDSELSFILK